MVRRTRQNQTSGGHRRAPAADAMEQLICAAQLMSIEATLAAPNQADMLVDLLSTTATEHDARRR